jgi:hypothetical protein
MRRPWLLDFSIPKDDLCIILATKLLTRNIVLTSSINETGRAQESGSENSQGR